MSCSQITGAASSIQYQRSTHVPSQFTKDCLKVYTLVDVLSVSSESQLLIIGSAEKRLFIYNAGGNHVTSLNVSESHYLYDAVWTSRGRIVYPIYAPSQNSAATVMSVSGDVIARTRMTAPSCLSSANKDVVYLTEQLSKTGVYQSLDCAV